MKLKCLVIDDDPLICDLIQHFCSKVSQIDFCLASNNALDGLSILTSQPFDLLFLDYNLPDLTGKSLLERKPSGTLVVMITSEKEFAVASYNYKDIVDFIVKPIPFDRFFQAVERVIEVKNDNVPDEGVAAKSIFVKDGNKLVQLYFNQIYFIKSESNYVIFQLGKKQIMSLISLKELLTKLPNNFVRTHRSYIVNVHKIDYIASEEVSIDQKQLPIGQKYKETLMGKVTSL